ncbi:hypothetical protein EBS80_01420 [bacterium]|nr:hypothetical protein [bacterium]
MSYGLTDWLEEPWNMKQMSSMVWKNFLRKNAKDLCVGIISGIVIANVFFLNSVSADVDTGPTYPDEATVALQIAAMQNQMLAYGDLPKAGRAPSRRMVIVPISAYTSEAAQTDSTPCIAARGFDLCAHGEEDVIAANFLPMGAKVRIPELYGTRIFTVVDRMNARYDRHVDVWMKDYTSAKSFGVKYATIEVL